jgi:CBS domain-containing protein
MPTLAIAFGIGIIAGLASGLLTMLVYGFEDLFTTLPIHWMWWPVIGGLFIGIGGLIEPRILGVGYDVIRDLLNGQIVGMALLTLLVVKALAWSIALGSGTSGGVLAPLIIMGGALGAIEAHWIPVGDVSLWVMLSMAAMMGGTMRAPLTAMVFTLELTHDLNVLPGLLVACIAAHGVTVLLLRRSILTEKVARHGHHLIREYSVDPLEVVRVGEIMDRAVPTLPATMTVMGLSEEIARGDSPLTRRQGTPIVDKEGNVIGILTRTDLLRALEDNPDGDVTVLEAGSRDLIVAYPDESLGTAVARMLKNDIGRLVVVSRQDPHRLLGYVGRSGVLTARLLRFQEEQTREPGWFARRLGSEVPDQPT